MAQTKSFFNLENPGLKQVVVAMIVMLGPPLLAMKIDFVPSDSLLVAGYAVFLFMLIALLVRVFLKQRNTKEEKPKRSANGTRRKTRAKPLFKPFTLKQKILIWPVTLLFVYGYFISIFDYCLPAVYTKIVGDQYSVTGVFEKRRMYKDIFCNYGISLQSAHVPFPHSMCISPSLYKSKTAEFEVIGKRSLLGILYTEVLELNRDSAS